MSGRSLTAGIFHPFTSRFSSLVSSSVDPLEREEIKIVFLIEPAALEELQRQFGSPGQGERIDRELHVSVRFFACFRFVVEDVNVSVADLQEVDVTGDNVAIEVQVESAAAVVADVLVGEKHRYFHRHRHGIVDEHEPLQGLMPLLVVRRGGEYQSRKARGMILLTEDPRVKCGGKC